MIQTVALWIAIGVCLVIAAALIAIVLGVLSDEEFYR